MMIIGVLELKMLPDFNNLENQNETVYFKTSIINYPIENSISGKGKYLNDKKD